MLECIAVEDTVGGEGGGRAGEWRGGVGGGRGPCLRAGGRVGAGEAAAGLLLASGAAAYFAASTRSGGLAGGISRRRLVAGSALLMAALLPLQLSVTGSVPLAVGVFCLIGLVAGIRTPASSGLGLEQLPDHPGAMMAARTAATQLGYLLGAAVGGALIA